MRKIQSPHAKNICGDFRKNILELTTYLTSRVNEKTREVGVVHASDEIDLLRKLALAVGYVNELHFDYEELWKENH